MISFRKKTWFVFILFFPLVVFAQEGMNSLPEYLLKFCTDPHCEICGYVDQNGDTIVPAGKYNMCLTDTIKNFGVVLQAGKGFIGIDKHGSFLFEIFLYDNGPDYISEGLFRITGNGKIGYADSTGTIVIKPRFECACPFRDGVAKVSMECTERHEGEHKIWESENWFYINKKGDKTEIP